jgi:hypothetical protein
MNHNRNIQIIILGLSLIIVLALAWPAVSVQAGPELPPRDPTATQPSSDDDDDDSDQPVGAYIELQAPGGAWAVVQWRDSSGNWRDVEGWRGSLPGSGRWWVHPKDFGAGLFRWVVLAEPGGAILKTSDPFHLPAGPNETTWISLEP